MCLDLHSSGESTRVDPRCLLMIVIIADGNVLTQICHELSQWLLPVKLERATAGACRFRVCAVVAVCHITLHSKTSQRETLGSWKAQPDGSPQQQKEGVLLSVHVDYKD